MWKPIIYDSEQLHYEVNELGEVRNSDTYSILKSNKKKAGYLEYCLYDNEGKAIYILGHILVAKAFIPNPERKEQVNHIDGNKANNNVNNLEWATASENNLHAWANGLNKPHVTRAVNQYSLQGEYIQTFDSIVAAMKATGASKVREVCNGTRQTSGGYMWTWVEDFIPEDRGRKKRVAQLDSKGNIIGIFESVSEAARQTGANRKGISAVCLGKQKTCFNYKWKFLEDEIVQ